MALSPAIDSHYLKNIFIRTLRSALKIPFFMQKKEILRTINLNQIVNTSIELKMIHIFPIELKLQLVLANWSEISIYEKDRHQFLASNLYQSVVNPINFSISSVVKYKPEIVSSVVTIPDTFISYP